MIKKLAFCFLLLVLAQQGAAAREQITRFNSNVTIEEDASLTVVETITVIAEGIDIRRGIIREFPTTYKDKQGHRIRVRFDIQDVRRDGSPEPYHTQKRSNGIDLYVGDADTFLTNGTYTYQITYKTDRQIGYFDGFDELYWNVTGNGWRLPITSVSYTLNLPFGADPINIAAYTGLQGADGQDFRVTADTAGLVSVETTRPFERYEGLTVAVSFPTGLVYQPTGSDKTRSFFRDNAGVFVAFIGLFMLIGYYLYFWDLKGRDPEGGAIIPLYGPPSGFSPAAARFVLRMSYDRTAFSSAVINMAVKGYLTIKDEGKTFKLTQTGTSQSALTSGEKRIASRLFTSGSSIVMKNENHKEISSAIRAFENGLQSEFQHEYFATNTAYFAIGITFTALIMLGAAFVNVGATNPVAAIVLQFLTATVAGITSFFALNWTQHRDAGDIGLSGFNWSSFMRTAKYFVIGLILVPQLFFSLFLSQEFGLALPLIALALGITNGLFIVLLKSPTRLGRKVMDEIEGFKLYLSVAEKDRLNLLNPPEQTPELFEKYLPFALALGVDNEWSEQFTSILSTAGTGGGNYQPTWYVGHHFRASRLSSFSSDLNSSFSSAIASSAQAPGSASGSGGGGFSGGGGGGGGGGGW
jgi:uncharacterized membrane protein YgcG